MLPRSPAGALGSAPGRWCCVRVPRTYAGAIRDRSGSVDEAPPTAARGIGSQDGSGFNGNTLRRQ